MQAQRALVGPKCMSVRNGFTIEIYGFMHSLRTFWHLPFRMPSRIARWHGDRGPRLEDRRRRRTSSDVWKTVNCLNSLARRGARHRAHAYYY